MAPRAGRKQGETRPISSHRTEKQNAHHLLGQKIHIPTDLVVAQEASDVESSSRLDFLVLPTLRRRFVAWWDLKKPQQYQRSKVLPL